MQPRDGESGTAAQPVWRHVKQVSSTTITITTSTTTTTTITTITTQVTQHIHGDYAGNKGMPMRRVEGR
jgi:hypothetical protein